MFPPQVLEHRHAAKMLSGFVAPLCDLAARARAAAGGGGVSVIRSSWSQASEREGGKGGREGGSEGGWDVKPRGRRLA